MPFAHNKAVAMPKAAALQASRVCLEQGIEAVRVTLGYHSVVQLFRTLKERKPGDADWDDLVAFLQEFCSLAKHLQLQQRQNCWARMTQLGMFEVSACCRQLSL